MSDSIASQKVNKSCDLTLLSRRKPFYPMKQTPKQNIES